MKCAKCDICGKYVNAWIETKYILDYWKDSFTHVEVTEVCNDCADKIQKFIKQMVVDESNQK